MSHQRFVAMGGIGLLSLLLVAPRLNAQPYLVKNIDGSDTPFLASSHPFVVGLAGDHLVFTADDDEEGLGLWATDGTAGGTRRLLDIVPEPSATNSISHLATLGDLLLVGERGGRIFSTAGTPGSTVGLGLDQLAQGEPTLIDAVLGTLDDPPRLLFILTHSDGEHLWISDGTPEGTRWVASVTDQIGQRVSLGDAMVYAQGFRQLSRSDGTRTGTGAVRDFQALHHLVALDGQRAVLVADDGVSGEQLWVTDGTSEGTRSIGGPGNPIGFLYGADGDTGRAFFTAFDASGEREIWSTDGTSGGTVRLTRGSEMELTGHVQVVGGLLYAGVRDAVHGRELLVSDGTEAGTRVLDICPGSCGSTPTSVAETSLGTLLHATDHLGQEPWLTDGTPAGTHRLADVCPGPCDAALSLLVDLGGKIILYPPFGSVLLVSDGTEAGTHSMTLPNGASLPIGASAGAVDGVAVFGASDDRGSEPWRTDGTAAGTFRLADLAQEGDNGSNPAHFEKLGDEAFFAASVRNPEWPIRGLWRTDGTEAGTQPVTSLPPTGAVIDVLAVNPELFVLTQLNLQLELWRTNGTAGGTQRIFTDDLSAAVPCCRAAVWEVGGEIYVLGPGLWRTDRTPASAHKLADVAFSEAAVQQGPGLFGGRLFFGAAAESVGGGLFDLELWTSDGSAAGTRLVRDLHPGEAASNPRDFLAFAGRLYFLANVDFARVGLWRTDGTDAGTELVFELDDLFFDARILGVAAGWLVLHDGETLWSTDGVDLVELGDQIGLGSAAAVPLDGQLYFLAESHVDGTGGRLWSTDGTPAGTRPAPGGAPAGHELLDLFRTHNELVLLVENPSSEEELWATDGTLAGRRRLAGLHGLRVHQANRFGEGAPPIALGDQLLFNADSPGIGAELWAVDLDSDLPPFGPPEPPSELRAEAASESGVRLRWRDDSEHESSFRITGTTAEAALGGSVSVPAGTESVIVQGLPPETPFTFTVAAVNAMGASPPSNEASGTLLPEDAGPCTAGAGTLCLVDGRFAVSVLWRDQHNGGTGTGGALPLSGSDRTGLFWFFDPANVELIVKALDGRGINGYFWSFYGALSDVEYWVTVVDTARRRSRTYHNRPGEICGVGDTTAFPEVSPLSGEASTSPDDAGDAMVVTWPFTAAAVEAQSASIGPLSPPPTPPLAATEASPDSHGRWRALPLPASEGPPSRAAAGIAPCVQGPETLCLLGGRLRFEVDWHDQHNGGSGTGQAVPGTDKSGFFWFFNPDNLELVVKALDGTAVNGRLWVFYGALTDVEYAITVTDTTTGLVLGYHNPPGEICGGADIGAF